MYGLHPVQPWLAVNVGFRGLHHDGQFRFGVDQVYLGKEGERMQYLVYVRPQIVSQLCQYPDNLPPFFAFQLADAVVSFHHLGGLDEHRLSAGRLVVHDAFHASLHCRCYGNHQTTVAYGRCHVFFH